MGSAAPKFPSLSDLSSLRAGSSAPVSLSCPAQAAPKPAFRFVSVCYTMIGLYLLNYIYIAYICIYTSYSSTYYYLVLT